jgi:hypothetical protein
MLRKMVLVLSSVVFLGVASQLFCPQGGAGLPDWLFEGWDDDWVPVNSRGSEAQGLVFNLVVDCYQKGQNQEQVKFPENLSKEDLEFANRLLVGRFFYDSANQADLGWFEFMPDEVGPQLQSAKEPTGLTETPKPSEEFVENLLETWTLVSGKPEDEVGRREITIHDGPSDETCERFPGISLVHIKQDWFGKPGAVPLRQPGGGSVLPIPPFQRNG